MDGYYFDGTFETFAKTSGSKLYYNAFDDYSAIQLVGLTPNGRKYVAEATSYYMDKKGDWNFERIGVVG